MVGAFLAGAGGAGLLEVVVVHLWSGWHHFVDRADPTAALRSDGLYAAALTIAGVSGLFLAGVTIARGWPVRRSRLIGAALAGAAFLNLTDAILAHWLLRLHLIRPGPDAWLVEAVWAFANLLLGALALRMARKTRVPGARAARGWRG